LSHQTAAELDGLTDRQSSLIHVTIPASRRVSPIRGVHLHTRLRAEQATHPARLPPRTKIQETVLDLTDSCDELLDAIGWVTAALGRRLATPELLRAAMRDRPRIRWRKDLDFLLSPDLAGVLSALEYLYVRDVETAHGLPRGKRQARVVRDWGSEYRDVLYEEFALVVELDGKLAHPGDKRWSDIRRDNAAAADGLATLRYGFGDLRFGPCLVAGQLDQVLRTRGWTGVACRCSPRCPVRRGAPFPPPPN